MKHALYLLLGLAISTPAHAQMWQDVQNSPAAKAVQAEGLARQVPLLVNARQLHLNTLELQQHLSTAPEERINTSNTLIQLPLPNGKFVNYTLYHSPIMSNALAKQYPEIQTYRVSDPTNADNTGRLDFTPNGFHAILRHEGKTIYIDPFGTKGRYQSYYKSDYVEERAGKNHSPINCLLDEHNHNKRNYSAKDAQSKRTAQKVDVSYGTDLRTYRIAVAATGEYSAFHGGTKPDALAAIVTAFNRINQVFERDLATKLELIANNSDVIYLDAATDPYTDSDPEKLIDEVSADMNSNIGVANFDIGHVFSTGGGGLAGLGVVCGTAKAEGVTGISNPINDPFYIDFVAHEIGHQFNANHTFNGTAGSCAGNREQTAAYEPGGATTIMGYAGICSSENVQNSGSDYYHNHSLGEMGEFIADIATGGSCGQLSTLANAVPVPSAGADGNIPISTPFSLTGSATDSNAGDSLTYVWEQYDLGGSTSSPATFTDDGARPLFRSFPPSTATRRTFPQISDILGGTTTYGEILPTTSRDLNFRFTVRDGKGGVASDSRKLAVDSAAGPFTVTAPGDVNWAKNSSQTVTWDVANTTAAPISCANVEIALSTDGGQNFGTVILASTANDGSQSVTVPNIETTTARMRVSCVTQPFFAINTVDFTISTSGVPNTNPVANNDSFSVDQDSAATNFAVLGNDTDADSDTLSITGVSNISNGGTVTVNGTNISYQPANGFSGTETFTYAISDGNGGADSATVTVTIAPSNNAPDANNDSYTVAQNSAATNLTVLSNDTDTNGDTLSITSISNISSGGSATINGTTISYRPATGFSGTESFTYVISDGNGGTDSATVTITVTPTSTGGGGGTPGGGSSGGGSFGLFLLFLLGLGGLVKGRRYNQQVNRLRGI